MFSSSLFYFRQLMTKHNHLLLIGSCSNAIAKNITSVVVNQILDKEENVFRVTDKKLYGLIREMKERGRQS